MPLAIENMTANPADMLHDNEVDVIVALPFEVPGIVTRAIYDEVLQGRRAARHRWEGRESIAPEDVAGTRCCC